MLLQIRFTKQSIDHRLHIAVCVRILGSFAQKDVFFDEKKIIGRIIGVKYGVIEKDAGENFFFVKMRFTHVTQVAILYIRKQKKHFFPCQPDNAALVHFNFGQFFSGFKFFVIVMFV